MYIQLPTMLKTSAQDYLVRPGLGSTGMLILKLRTLYKKNLYKNNLALLTIANVLYTFCVLDVA